jgi:hypothetical protein
VNTRVADGYLTGWGGLNQGLPGLHASKKLVDPAERYGLLRLVAHLAAAGHAEAIDRLLAMERPTRPAPTGPARVDNLWYVVHDEAGETSAYLGDVRLARQLAEVATDRALAQGSRASSIGLEVRYSLAWIHRGDGSVARSWL